MIANAWHHRADAISSVVALIGVGEELHLFVITLFSILIFAMVIRKVATIATSSDSLLDQLLFSHLFFFFFHVTNLTHAILMYKFNLHILCITAIISLSI